MKVKKWAKIGEKVQNSQPLSPGGGTRGVETRARARRTPRDPPDTSARARRAGGVFMCKRGEMSENFLDFYEETKK